jgi:acyl-CoA thioesterase-1
MRERTKRAIGTACRAIVATIAGRVAAGGRCCTLFVIALAFGALAACGSARENALPAGTAVLVVGDSITAGYGVRPDEAWPANLARSTGWNVIAAGVSGERSEGGRGRLPALLDLHAPNLVIIELGGNDMLRRAPDADIVGNLDAMIEAARARGAKVVLMAVPRPNALGALTGLSPAAFYRELAQRRHVALIEKALPAVLSDARLKLDALHPTVEGHKALADAAVDELAAIGFVARR